MIRHLGSSLTDVTYIFDEPTIGLHAHDVERDERAPAAPARQGQHGPRRRARPGGDPDRRPRRRHGSRRRAARRRRSSSRAASTASLASGTATGRHLDVRQDLKREPRSPRGSIPIRNARLHNLKDVSVDVPLGVLVAVSGVAGSGKSSLIHGCLPRTDPSVTVIDQSAIRGSRRSNPATYTGILDPIRTRLREGERRQAGPVQRELGRRLPGLQRPRQDLHQPRVHGRGGQRVRGVRGPPLHRRGARLPAARPQHRRGAGDAGRGGARLLHRAAGARHARAPGRRRASATSRSARSWTRCRAASASA